MDFLVKFQTWACDMPFGLGSNWSLFIHKSWKGSVHTEHVEVLFLKQLHMVALLSTAAWPAFELGAVGKRLRVSAPNSNDFVDTGIRWTQKNCTIAIWRAPLHMEAIISNGPLRLFFPVSKKSLKFSSQPRSSVFFITLSWQAAVDVLLPTSLLFLSVLHGPADH